MSDSPSQENRRPGWLNLTSFILMALGFLGGFGSNYWTKSAQLDTVITTIAELSKDFKSFTKDYNTSHEETAISIKALNQHLEYTDRRLADLEARFSAR